MVYGVWLGNQEQLLDLIHEILGIKPNITELILLAQKDKNNVWSKISKDVIKLIFSHVSNFTNVKHILYNKVKKHTDKEFSLENKLFEHYPYKTIEEINKLLKDYGYCLTIGQKRCCYNDGSYFFGYEVGDTYFVYRSEVEDYETFDKYHNYNMKQLIDIKENYYKNKEKIDKDFARIERVLKKKMFTYEIIGNDMEDIYEIDGYEVYEELYENFNEKKFYTFANDCENCS